MISQILSYQNKLICPQTNYYPGCLPCLRAIAQNLCTLGGDATPDEEADQGGVNCHGAYANSACDYCDADNPIGRLPRDCIEPVCSATIYLL
jgi:hypothetical protein